MSDETWILVGVVGAPHGVRGDLRLKSYTGEPMGIAGFPSISTGEQPRRSLTFAAARPLKDDMLVVRFKGVETREAAQALTNTKLYVARSELPQTDEDEYYHADLIGLAAKDAKGNDLGHVAALENFGAGDLLEIVPSRGDSFYVPFTRAFVPVVDLGGRKVVLAPEALPSDETEDEAEG